MGAVNILSLFVGVGVWGLVTAEETCPYIPPIVWIGRDNSPSTAWCEPQIPVCDQLCGGSALVNTCDPDTFCYECTCSDGSTPDLEPYTGSVLNDICWRNYRSCMQQPMATEKTCDDMNGCAQLDPYEAGFSIAGTSTAAANVATLLPVFGNTFPSASASASASVIVVTKTPDAITVTAQLTSTASFASDTPSYRRYSSSSAAQSGSEEGAASPQTGSALNATTSSLMSIHAKTSSASLATITSSSSPSSAASSDTGSAAASGVAATLSGAAAMVTGVPWTGAALGMVGLVMAAL